MKIQLKITLLMILALVVSGGAMVSNAFLGISDFAHEQIEQNSQRGQALVTELISQQQGSVNSISQTISSNRVLQVALKYNTGDKQEMMTKFYKQYHENDAAVTAVELTDNQGVVLARGHNPKKNGDNKSANPLVARALKGEAAAGLNYSKSSGKVSLDSVYPIVFQEEVVGTLKVGSYLNNDFAHKLKLLSGSDIVFIAGNQVVGHSISELTQEKMTQSLNILADQSLSDLNLNGLHYARNELMLEGGNDLNAKAVLLTDLTVIEEAQSQMIRNMVLFGFFIAVALMALTFALVRNIVKPITQVTEFLSTVSERFDFKARLQLSSKDETKQMGEAVNQLLDQLDQGVYDVNDVLKSLADGDFTHRVKKEYVGDLDQLKQNVNQTAENISEVMRQTNQALDWMSTGQFDQTISHQAKGDYKAILDKVSMTLSSLSEIIVNIDSVMNKVAGGDFAQRVDAPAQGQLDSMKSNINETMQQLESVVGDIVQVMQAQSKGDLTKAVSIECSGQLLGLKDSINHNATNLNDIILKVQHIAQEVNQSAKEVAQGAMDLSDRVQQNAASVEEGSATMEEFSAAVLNNAKSAKQATQLEQEVQQQAKQAALVMDQTIEAMSAIQESSHKIADIVTIIDGIAFQTNLLALNAAVEAARAGDHGRGFAVVAGEVRSLAGKSAEAAKDISRLINESVERINQGTRLAGESGEAINGITQRIETVAEMSEQIANASQEQTKGVQQLQQAISSIDSATQQNAALVEETSAAAESMSDQSRGLETEMAFFTISQNGQVKLTPPPKIISPVTKPAPSIPKKEEPAPMKSSAPIPSSDDEWGEF
ncbi:methyl-accepting chemotaxis protein [Hydrogenovibrio sp. SC-1]|uniref:methyl-accepting chemotaxis protein n=1 Tax=Hydrogenovibrio sp. SC-1 TaxID=2065820 RepID=UPI00117B6EAD|nr:methyl-accepting chemotaxis protein [Hydrogenovibrio sp. SC-1]